MRYTAGMADRLLVHDRTCRGRLVGLSTAWATGSRLYRAAGRLDDAIGVASWSEAFAWLEAHDQPIAELQFWGHGTWGVARVDREPLDAGALTPGHPLHRGLEALRARLAPDALVWFRTCQTFGAGAGHDLAARLADWLGVRVAGHTHVIGFHQSGLHGLRPGASPQWSPLEGLAEGTPDTPLRALGSRPWAPHTITCLQSSIPPAWFDS